MQNEEQSRVYSLYVGIVNNKIVYVGTTIQKPKDRWRWHKSNGKDFKFQLIMQCKDEKEMLDLEFQLIKTIKPKHNTITHRKQNFNVELSNDKLEQRKGNKEWCQSCLKRRVNKGYQYCYWCSK